MGLTSDEIDLCKFELGYPLTRIGAEPYITYAAVFDKAIIPYLTDTLTSSSSAVVASSAGAIATITLSAATGFVQGSNVVVDVGPSQETSVLVTVVGTTATLNLFNAHGAGGAYPVRLRGAEFVIRDILQRLQNIHTLLRGEAPYSAGVQKADGEVTFFGSLGSGGRGNLGMNRTEVLFRQRADARDELASGIGLPNLRRARNSGSANLALY